jgi:CBS domain-containing protein
MKAQNLLLVERVMKFMPWTVQPSDSVAHARALLDDQRINNLPVISKGKLVGVVSARICRRARCRPRRTRTSATLRFTRTAFGSPRS